MYDATRLKQGMSGLVGFLQPYDPSYSLLPTSLTATSSGRSVQKTHPLCTIETINNIAPEFDKFDYPAWAAQDYSASTMVLHSGKIWRAAVNLLAAYPQPGSGAGSENWVETTPFAAWLQDLYDTSVLELCADLIRWKKLDQSNRTLLDSMRLYDGLGQINDRIIKKGRFVGFEIKIREEEGMQLTLDKVGIQLDTIQAEIPMKLYHSSIEEPLKEFNIAAAKANTFQWSAVSDVIMKHWADTHDSHGVYYLGYFEDSLTGDTQAVKRNSAWGSEPCYGCTGWNHYAWSNWSKYFTINAISVPTAALNGNNLFDASKVEYENSTNWGLNLQVTVACDLTEFFILNKNQMGDSLAKKICLKLLAEIGFTTRMNFINDKTRALAIADLSETDKDSFLNKYLSELKALALDFSGMSSHCMPCNDKRRINMGAA